MIGCATPDSANVLLLVPTDAFSPNHCIRLTEVEVQVLVHHGQPNLMVTGKLPATTDSNCPAALRVVLLDDEALV
jgi:hypothetical protein